jgi:hypothetical protein
MLVQFFMHFLNFATLCICMIGFHSIHVQSNSWLHETMSARFCARFGIWKCHDGGTSATYKFNIFDYAICLVIFFTRGSSLIWPLISFHLIRESVFSWSSIQIILSLDELLLETVDLINSYPWITLNLSNLSIFLIHGFVSIWSTDHIWSGDKFYPIWELSDSCIGLFFYLEIWSWDILFISDQGNIFYLISGSVLIRSLD